MRTSAQRQNPPPVPEVPTRPGTITLVRHGEPALSRKTRMNAKGYGAWWAIYEDGGLLDVQKPPADVVELVQRAPVLMVSTRRRAQESMRVLAPGRAFDEHEVFIEAPLPPPPLPGFLKLPPRWWGFIARFCWYWLGNHGGQESLSQAWKRARRAADMLIELAEKGDAVVLVAHGFFNAMIEVCLLRSGWQRTRKTGGFTYWSVRGFQKL